VTEASSAAGKCAAEALRAARQPSSGDKSAFEAATEQAGWQAPRKPRVCGLLDERPAVLPRPTRVLVGFGTLVGRGTRAALDFHAIAVAAARDTRHFTLRALGRNAFAKNLLRITVNELGTSASRPAARTATGTRCPNASAAARSAASPARASPARASRARSADSAIRASRVRAAAGFGACACRSGASSRAGVVVGAPAATEFEAEYRSQRDQVDCIYAHATL